MIIQNRILISSIFKTMRLIVLFCITCLCRTIYIRLNCSNNTNINVAIVDQAKLLMLFCLVLTDICWGNIYELHFLTVFVQSIKRTENRGKSSILRLTLIDYLLSFLRGNVNLIRLSIFLFSIYPFDPMCVNAIRNFLRLLSNF